MSVEEEKQLVVYADKVEVAAKEEKIKEDADYNVGLHRALGLRGLYINRQNRRPFTIKQRPNDNAETAKSIPNFYEIYKDFNSGGSALFKEVEDINKGAAFAMPLSRFSSLLLPPLGTMMKTGAGTIKANLLHTTEWEMGICDDPLFADSDTDSNPYFTDAMQSYEAVYQAPIVTQFKSLGFGVKDGKKLPYVPIIIEETRGMTAARKAFVKCEKNTTLLKYVRSAEHLARIKTNPYYEQCAFFDKKKPYAFDARPWCFYIEHISTNGLVKLSPMTPLQQSMIKLTDMGILVPKAKIGIRGFGGVEVRLDNTLAACIWFGDVDIIMRNKKGITSAEILHNVEKAREGDPTVYLNTPRPDDNKDAEEAETAAEKAEYMKWVNATGKGSLLA